jgi:hypothetical protein
MARTGFCGATVLSWTFTDTAVIGRRAAGRRWSGAADVGPKPAFSGAACPTLLSISALCAALFLWKLAEHLVSLTAALKSLRTTRIHPYNHTTSLALAR